jgi:hypothetical protein
LTVFGVFLGLLQPVILPLDALFDPAYPLAHTLNVPYGVLLRFGLDCSPERFRD